jgi:hypothetical protein
MMVSSSLILQLASFDNLLPGSTTETKCNYAQAEKSIKTAIKPF